MASSAIVSILEERTTGLGGAGGSETGVVTGAGVEAGEVRAAVEEVEEVGKGAGVSSVLINSEELILNFFSTGAYSDNSPGKGGFFPFLFGWAPAGGTSFFGSYSSSKKLLGSAVLLP